MNHKAYKFRIYPNKTQSNLIDQTCGMVRKYWNQCVAAFNGYHKDYCPKPIYLTPKEFREKYEWAKELSHAVLSQKFRDFYTTKSQYFNKKRKKPLGRMKFKSKHHNRNSYRLPSPKFRTKEGKVRLEKIGWVKFDNHREIKGRMISCTVSKNKCGQYFVSIMTEQEIEYKTKTNKSIGIDVGVKDFYTDSDGNTVENPRYFSENQTKIARLQRFLAKKVKGSRRFKKLKRRIAKEHQRLVNKRDWFLHQISNDLINRFDKIVIEDLDIQGMIEKKLMSKEISNVSWSKFFEMLTYKCDWYGKELIKIDRFYPSTKTCSQCGKIQDIKLSQRVYKCSCGLSMSRDKNAAINILALGVNSA